VYKKDFYSADRFHGSALHGDLGMLIHQQSSYAPRGKRRPGRREAQSRGTGQQS
jgi:hypothetical protein